VEDDIEDLLRDVSCTSISGETNTVDDIVSDIDSNTVPIIRTSAVDKTGIDTLDELFSNLPKTRLEDDNGDFKMYIDKTYVVEGVGTVVSGTIMSGSVTSGDDVYLGPTSEGGFIDTKARSIEIHYHQVDEANAGQLVSIALQNIDEDQVRRGMVLTDSESNPVREFEAEVVILNHPTRVAEGYEPVVHLETVNETVQMEPENPPLLPGDNGTAKLRFKFNPYLVEEGQRFVLREGESKGVGTVTEIIEREN
jgi:elongation factor 1-alpha